MHGIEDFPEFVKTLPEVELPFPGCRGWLLQCPDHQVVFAEFVEDLEVPRHSHAEQWELCLAGRVLLHLDEGSQEYHSGDNFFIPAGQSHAANVYAGYKAMIVFNAPDRYQRKA